MTAEKIIAIHQPNFLPWLGFFQKLCCADCFVLLDDVQFVKNSWINRTRIKGRDNHEGWLTVPVHYHFSARPPINAIAIDNSRPWQQDHLEKLKNYYATAPYFEEVFAFLAELYDGHFHTLAHFNTLLLTGFLQRLRLDKTMLLASQFHLDHTGSQRLIELIRLTAGTTYLCGDGSSGYLDRLLFAQQRIDIRFMQYQQPLYPRNGNSAAVGLSIVDAAFHCGFKRLRELLTQYPASQPNPKDSNDA